MSKRRKLKCIKCEKEFSTYSSNRDQCHDCKPKCRERHTFPKHQQEKAKAEQEAK